MNSILIKAFKFINLKPNVKCLFGFSLNNNVSRTFSSIFAPKPILPETKISLNTPLLTQLRTYKAKTRLRKRCRHCFFIWRNGRLYVECPEHPRHKQHHKTALIKGFDSVANGL